MPGYSGARYRCQSSIGTVAGITKRSRFRYQPPAWIPKVVFKRDRLSWRRFQIARCPLVQDDLIAFRRIHRRHDRIRDFPPVCPDRVRHVREHGLCLRVDLLNSFHEFVVEHHAGMFHHAVLDFQAHILERETASDVRLGIGSGQRDVRTAVQFQIALEALQINENRPDGALLRSQRELAHTLPGDHFAHAAPNGTAGIVFASVERFRRDLRSSRDANENVIVGLCAQFRRERIAQEEFIAIRRLDRSMVKRPEPLIDRIELDFRSAPTIIVVRDDRLQRDHRTLGKKLLPERRVR